MYNFIKVVDAKKNYLFIKLSAVTLVTLKAVKDLRIKQIYCV